MSDIVEIPESGEGQAEVAELEQATSVEIATFEPEAAVEREIEIETSEAVEAAFVGVVEARSTEEVSATPITLPREDSEPRPA